MTDNLNGTRSCARNDKSGFLQAYPSILTLETPDVEEIARAIWQRQHDTLAPDAISSNAKWRDESIPSKFWDEFLHDAHVVLLLLYKKHIEYQSTRA